MDKNQKNFNLYVFFSSFAKNLIEVFIPIILYKFGYSIKEVMFYYLICNIGALIFMFPCIYLSKKYDNRLLCFIGIISFAILQLMLNNIQYSYIYLLELGTIYALYRRGYWISRRFYNLKIMHKDNISKSYSLISIVNQLSIILSTYIGALLLDFINIKVLTFISIIIFILSVIPLYKLNFKHEKSKMNINIIKTLKSIPLTNIYLFGTYEFTTIISFLFSLYLYIYVKNNYQVVGLFNLIANGVTILFAYLYGKKINNDKNYLKLSIFAVVCLYLFKANITSYLLVIIAMIEGIVSKMHEISISKEFYTLSKKFEYANYNATYELIQNSFRTMMVLILYLFVGNVKTMIYVVLIFMAVGMLFNFKQIDVSDYDIDSEM